MKILKFGGSSSANRDTIEIVRGIIEMHYRQSPRLAVVVSAFGVLPGSKERKTTDLLFQIADYAWQGNTAEALAALNLLRKSHSDKTYILSEGGNFFEQDFSELESMVSSPDSTLRKDAFRAGFARFGETMAARFYKELLNQSGIPALYADASDHGFVTGSEDYEDARLSDTSLNKEIARGFRKLADKNPNKVLVYTGYIAKNETGEWTLLGRDGSNTTALALGGTINANQIVIYSDVDGILKADPRIIGEAQTIRALSYPEVYALSDRGVNVFQQASLHVLRKKGRLPPIRIRSIYLPYSPGTLITSEVDETHSVMKGMGVVGDLSYREFNVGSAEQFRAIQKAIGGYEGAELLWSQLTEDHNGKVGRFIIKTNSRFSESKPDYFKRDLFYRILGEAGDSPLKEGGSHWHNMSLLTIGGYNIGNSPDARARIEEVVGEVLPQGSGTRRNLHRFPVIVGDHSIALVTRNGRVNDIARRLYKDLKTINLILYGPGNVGQRLLRMVADNYKELGLNVVGIVDSHGYVTRVGGLSIEEVLAVADYKKERGKFDGSPIEDLDIFDRATLRSRNISHQNTLILKRLLDNERGDFILVDASDSDDMLQTLAAAIGKGVVVISANKKPYAVDYSCMGSPGSELSYLFEAVGNGKALNRATVGANLGVPDTTLEVLSENPDCIAVMGCMSGTLNYINSRTGDGAESSKALNEAVNMGCTEPTPCTDLSGMDVLRKMTILWRMIANHYNIQFDNCVVEHETFLEPALRIAKERGVTLDVDAIKDKEGKEFVERVKILDDAFSELMQQAGPDMVLRYVGSIAPHNRTYHLKTGLVAVHKDSVLGSLRGTDNVVLFGKNNEKPRIYFPPGPGAGTETTADALFYCLTKAVKRLRS